MWGVAVDRRAVEAQDVPAERNAVEIWEDILYERRLQARGLQFSVSPSLSTDDCGVFVKYADTVYCGPAIALWTSFSWDMALL